MYWSLYSNNKKIFNNCRQCGAEKSPHSNRRITMAMSWITADCLVHHHSAPEHEEASMVIWAQHFRKSDEREGGCFTAAGDGAPVTNPRQCVWQRCLPARLAWITSTALNLLSMLTAVQSSFSTCVIQDKITKATCVVTDRVAEDVFVRQMVLSLQFLLIWLGSVRNKSQDKQSSVLKVKCFWCVLTSSLCLSTLVSLCTMSVYYTVFLECVSGVLCWQFC